MKSVSSDMSLTVEMRRGSDEGPCRNYPAPFSHSYPRAVSRPGRHALALGFCCFSGDHRLRGPHDVSHGRTSQVNYLSFMSTTNISGGTGIYQRLVLSPLGLDRETSISFWLLLIFGGVTLGGLWHFEGNVPL